VLHIQAPANVVRERLLARGRETGADLEARILRSQDLTVERSPGDMELMNADSLDASGQQLLALLAALPQAGSP